MDYSFYFTLTSVVEMWLQTHLVIGLLGFEFSLSPTCPTEVLRPMYLFALAAYYCMVQQFVFGITLYVFDAWILNLYPL